MSDRTPGTGIHLANEGKTHWQTLHVWSVPSLMSPFSKNSQTSSAVDLAGAVVRMLVVSDGAIEGPVEHAIEEGAEGGIVRADELVIGGGVLP